MTFEYEYVKGPEQYGTEPLIEVNAKYVREQTEEKLQGFPFWEALPVFPPFDPKKHTVNLEDFGPVPEFDTPDGTKKDMLNKLDKVRVNLPFRAKVEEYIRRAMMVSYRDRADFIMNRSVHIVENNEDAEQSVCFTTPLGGHVSNGVTVTGWSGCGKTTAVDETLMRYPRIIVHNLNGRRMKQIVFVKLDCLANRNLRNLFDSFGTQLDELMGNSNKAYYSLIHKEKTIGGKSEAVVRLIKEFAIGALVLDEVQMLDFDSEKDSSYTAFMTIVNKTKVALISVGTDEAVAKLYGYWHTARRAGVNIPADEYCVDENYMIPFIAKLFRWHFFDKEIPVTKEIIKAYKECSGGTVERIVSIHKAVVSDYIDNGKTATVDGAYITDVACRTWPRLAAIIAEKAEKRKGFVKTHGSDTTDAVEELKDIEKYYAKQIAMIGKDSRSDEIIRMVKNVLNIIGEMYSDDKISDAMTAVSKLKAYDDMSVNDAAAKVLSKLKKKGSDKRPGSKPNTGLIEEFKANGLTIKNI